MAAQIDLSVQVETLLSNERANRRSWYRRPMPDLPRWFVETPDGLDPEQKRDVFDRTASNINRALAVGMSALAGTLSVSVTSLVRHHWNTAAVVLMLAVCICGVCLPWLRRKLIDRQLRRQFQL